ncbi:MAG TPA: zf-HC2 domain-containing protein [Pyrinomonadaceae bacterium]|nr:zf-HC2 domain-containing protein [Pyrinomonadaceae bacterium]
MELNVSNSSGECLTDEIAAYIDGELSPDGEMRLEMHLAGCPQCALELNSQKQFLRALDLSLENAGEMELPVNFTRTVVTTAESRVNGLRGPAERRNAILIGSALFLVLVFAIGSDLPSVLSTFRAAVDQIAAVAGIAAHFLFGVALGAAVVFRSLAAQFVFGPALAAGMIAVLFVLAIFVFSRRANRGGRAWKG